MLGGGVGRLQGLHGLTSDNVRKVRLALWNGTIIDASDKVNSDLFWGVRGAGQNFGVVIETTYETYPASNGGQHYEANLAFSVDKVGSVIDAMNALVPLPAPLSLILVGTVDPATLEVSLMLRFAEDVSNCSPHVDPRGSQPRLRRDHGGGTQVHAQVSVLQPIPEREHVLVG